MRIGCGEEGRSVLVGYTRLTAPLATASTLLATSTAATQRRNAVRLTTVRGSDKLLELLGEPGLLWWWLVLLLLLLLLLLRRGRILLLLRRLLLLLVLLRGTLLRSEGGVRSASHRRHAGRREEGLLGHTGHGGLEAHEGA